ncbi:hypothetical protein MAHJHV57_49890 [Mycobacterium avium subsp. hominissuis]
MARIGLANYFAGDLLTWRGGSELFEFADVEVVDPTGAGCKICDRPACPQRAFPYLGRPVSVDPHRSTDLTGLRA